MKTESIEIENYNDKYKEQLIAVWEKSVLETHDFLKKSDFLEIKEVMKSTDFNALTVFNLKCKNNIIGFIGINNRKIEMLFLSPDFIGKGFGKKLVNFVVKKFNVNEVDVNEQNNEAISFYEKLGFETYARTETDAQGKNYPILKMRLKEIFNGN